MKVTVNQTVEQYKLTSTQNVDQFRVIVSESISTIRVTVASLGASGLSAYDIAVVNGFVGTQQQWLQSLQGQGSTAALTNKNVLNELLQGAKNGMNATFFSLFGFIPESVVVLVNGLTQSQPDDYITTGTNTVLLSVSPDILDNVRINYIKLV